MPTSSFALVIHGGSVKGVKSDNRIKTITPAGVNLTFAQARQYFYDGKGPEYSSVNFSQFDGLSDAEYQALFDSQPSPTEPQQLIYDTGLHVGRDFGKMKIYVCRNDSTTLTYEDIKTFLPADGSGKIVLVACRGYSPETIMGGQCLRSLPRSTVHPG